jgi:hypothetical protein
VSFLLHTTNPANTANGLFGAGTYIANGSTRAATFDGLQTFFVQVGECFLFQAKPFGCFLFHIVCRFYASKAGKTLGLKKAFGYMSIITSYYFFIIIQSLAGV